MSVPTLFPHMKDFKKKAEESRKQIKREGDHNKEMKRVTKTPGAYKFV